MIRKVIVASLVIGSFAARAAEVLLPAVTPVAYGSANSVWASEVRLTNLSGVEAHFSVVDWIGTPGWRPKAWAIPPHSSLSIGGFDILNDQAYAASHPAAIPIPAFGAAIADADEGLIIQVAILTGIAPLGGIGNLVYCEPWNGGYLGSGGTDGPCARVGPCDTGAGPLLDATDFFPAGSTILLTWLHTDPERRTNVVFINPDPTPATVDVTYFAADGTAWPARRYQVGAHSLLQTNDVFSGDLASLRAYNVGLPAAAARATLRSNTRLYALSYVISNLNNTVTVGTPRLVQ